MVKLLLSFFGLLLVLPAFAQNSSDQLTASLTRQFTASGFPGFCVSVIKNGHVTYQHGFGYADVAAKTPYTADTIQPVGSVSKTVIGIALMKAVELGYFSLDTPVNDICPFQVSTPDFPKSRITIRQLATHTSGIVDRPEVYEQTYQFGKIRADVSLGAFLSSYLTAGGKCYSTQNYAPGKPGTAFHYSNIGATLAAYLIEVKSKMSFAEFSEKYVLQPLQMKSSGWFNRAENLKRTAALYNPQLAPYPVYASVTYPDGSLRSSCADLGKYLIEIIQGYSGASTRLLGKNSFRQMLSPQFSPQNMPQGVSKREPNQGLFFAFRHDGLIGHTGSDYGVSAFLFFNPKTNSGKIFMTNTDIQENPALAKQFAQIWRTLDNR